MAAAPCVSCGDLQPLRPRTTATASAVPHEIEPPHKGRTGIRFPFLRPRPNSALPGQFLTRLRSRWRSNVQGNHGHVIGLAEPLRGLSDVPGRLIADLARALKAEELVLRIGGLHHAVGEKHDPVSALQLEGAWL